MQHAFSHQSPYHQPDWQHQPHAAHSQYAAQTQAAAAANAVAQQQQHYGRAMSAAGQNGGNAANLNNASNGGGSGLNSAGPLGALPTGDHGGASMMGAADGANEDNRRVLEWITQVLNANTREAALLELSKKREQVPELALILWHSFGEFRVPLWWRDAVANVTGVMTSLLQEIISVYPLLNPSQLTAAASNRVCNALALLQCVASHSETRGLFLNGMYAQGFETFDAIC